MGALSMSPPSPARKAIPMRRPTEIQGRRDRVDEVAGQGIGDKQHHGRLRNAGGGMTAIFDQMSQSHIDFMLSKIRRGMVQAPSTRWLPLSHGWRVKNAHSPRARSLMCRVDARPTEARQRANRAPGMELRADYQLDPGRTRVGRWRSGGGVRGVGDWNFLVSGLCGTGAAKAAGYRCSE